jgi:hypothetical protein
MIEAQLFFLAAYFGGSFAPVIIWAIQAYRCGGKAGHDWWPIGFADWRCKRCGRDR